MAKSAMKRQPAQTSASIDLDVGLAAIATMNVEQLAATLYELVKENGLENTQVDTMGRAAKVWHFRRCVTIQWSAPCCNRTISADPSPP